MIIACVIVPEPKLPIPATSRIGNLSRVICVHSMSGLSICGGNTTSNVTVRVHYTIVSPAPSKQSGISSTFIRFFSITGLHLPLVFPLVLFLLLILLYLCHHHLPHSLLPIFSFPTLQLSPQSRSYSTLILSFQSSRTYSLPSNKLNFKMHLFLNILLLPLLLPSLVLSSPPPSAVPTKPAQAHHGRKFTLKSHVLSPPNPAFDNLDLEPYHIYPAFNYAVLVSGQKGIVGYLNGTRQEFADRTVSTYSSLITLIIIKQRRRKEKEK